MTAQAAQQKAKKTTRTCVACGTSNAKVELVRFVRSKDGDVSCDSSGRAAGRGAYLCPSEECFSTAEKRGRLSATLRCPLSQEDYRRLEKTFREVCSEQQQLS